MDKLKFIDNIREQFENPESVELNAESVFRNISSYDSLTGMSILVTIKDEYNVDIPEDTYRSLKTVDELYTFVLKNM